jgi:hypothetical protein
VENSTKIAVETTPPNPLFKGSDKITTQDDDALNCTSSNPLPEVLIEVAPSNPNPPQVPAIVVGETNMPNLLIEVAPPNLNPTPTPTPSPVVEETYEEGDVVTPRETDVKFGRGSGSNPWPGNEAMREIVISWQPYYKDPQRTVHEKTDLSRRIVDEIQNDLGGRFIERHGDGSWHVASNAKARAKISTALRQVYDLGHYAERRRRYPGGKKILIVAPKDLALYNKE